jgi:ABC-type glycerol-3-phosphate transport system substrate-binding protein
MDELTFSIFNHGNVATAQMNKLLKEFEQREKIHVRLEMIPWSMGWQRLVEMALYHTGPDISEIGSTWIMDFVRMDALRPYSHAEVDEITGGRRYFEASWSGGVIDVGNGKAIWAVPLGGDARVVFYRRDLLEQAGIDETKAFTNVSRFENTLALLNKVGVPIPLSLPTGRSRNNIHSLATWVWSMGGDFISKDGKRMEFDKPAALEGFKAYFALGRYLGREHVLEEYDSDAAYHQGRAAVTISGYWILHEVVTPEVITNLGVASMPGVPFVGGEHLIIWKHSHRHEQALRLAQFLSTKEAGNVLYPHFGLPVTLEGWDREPFINRPGYDVLLKAMQNGRSFSANQLWGLVEKRLSDLLPDIWNEVAAHPEKLDTIVENYIGGLAKRLQMTIKS